MRPPAALALLLVALALAGCGSAAPSPGPSYSAPPRTRCLADPHETGARPLLFLFCVETP